MGINEQKHIEKYKDWVRWVKEIEEKVFGKDKPQIGLLINRVAEIESKTGLKPIKDKPKIEERIVYLFGKIIGFGGTSPF